MNLFVFIILGFGYMKKLLYWFMFLIIWFFVSNSAFAYKELLIENRGGRPIRVIKVVLDGEHFVVASPAENWWATTEQLAKNVWWDTAINWAFFCPADYSTCKLNWKRITHTVSERVYLWEGAKWSMYWWDTSIRMIFWFDKEWTPLFVQKNSWEADLWLWSNLNKDKLDDLYFWIWNWPVLLMEWEDVVHAFSHYIDNKLTWLANRNFICSTEDNTTIYMWVVWSSSVWNLPAYLKEQFWCYNALFLDAWASTAMVYDGHTLDRWSRKKVMDAFVVLDREQYIKLTWITPAEKSIPKVEGYQPTASDEKRLKNVKDVIDLIYKKYWKSKYRWPFIRIIRGMMNDSLPADKKWLYNQVLIYLFTIDSF